MPGCKASEALCPGERMMTETQLANLVRMDSPEAVFEEVVTSLKMILPSFESTPLHEAFETVVRLFRGQYPGYKACNTQYHNLRHTTDDFLAMARLIHGSTLQGHVFSPSLITIALIATLFHDVGYIQETEDGEGTGAKYTIGHVQRSMDFLEEYGRGKGLPDQEIHAGRTMILCTELGTDFSRIRFPSKEVELLGRMLGTADLLAQMADRTYLEKLLFLYYEFKEGRIGDYESEEDFLRKSISFFEFAKDRLKNTLGGVDRFMLSHFAHRWGIHTDLYRESMDRHHMYLEEILQKPDFTPDSYLKRDGIVKKVRALYGPNGR